jgi:type I restriction enzyme S subunit
LLERLQIVEINYKSIIETDQLRLEAEFYTATSFEMSDSYSGEEIIDLVQYGTSKELNEENIGYPILRLNEFNGSFISEPAKYCSLIDETTYQSIKLSKNDVLICRTNGNPRYVGKSAIVPQDYNYGYASYLFKIRPKPKLINAATLVAFLNSKYGRMEIEKYSMASNQVNFSPAKFRQLRIPKFGKKLNDIIEEITYESFSKIEESSTLYKNAEKVLLDEISFKNLKTTKTTINIKSLKTSFGASGRLDAEYYQPKYEQYGNLISTYKNGSRKLDLVCDLNNFNYSPIDNQEYKYIELSNVGKSGSINGLTIDLGKNLPSRARRIVKTGDVIVSSIEGSLSSCALITPELDNALCSTGFYVIQSNVISSETLLVLFKSELIQNIMKQNCSGTILTAINKDEFTNIILPLIDIHIQREISILVEKSFALKQQSEYLIVLSKRAIEIAINESEQKAISYIQNNIL